MEVIITPRGCGKTAFFAQQRAYAQDPHDMELLEEVDETDLEAESFAVFNE